MKNLIGLSLAILLCIPSIYAQKGKSDRQKEKDPSARIESAIKDLNLNEKQAVEFRKIEEKYGEQFKKERTDFDKEREAFRENVKDIHKQRETDLKKVMTDEQYAKYRQEQKRHRSDPNESHKGPKKGHHKNQRPNGSMCDPA